jgi:hypothetical protein
MIGHDSIHGDEVRVRKEKADDVRSTDWTR